MRTSAQEHALRGRGVKLTNPHAKALGTLYDDVPKAVLAAICVDLLRDTYLPLQVSPLTDVGAQRIRESLMAEWVALHEKGVVPQAPPKDWRN